jgi:hypothetical protein
VISLSGCWWLQGVAGRSYSRVGTKVRPLSDKHRQSSSLSVLSARTSTSRRDFLPLPQLFFYTAFAHHPYYNLETRLPAGIEGVGENSVRRSTLCLGLPSTAPSNNDLLSFSQPPESIQRIVYSHRGVCALPFYYSLNASFPPALRRSWHASPISMAAKCCLFSLQISTYTITQCLSSRNPANAITS